MNEIANPTGKLPEILPDIIDNEGDIQIRSLVSEYSNTPLFKKKVDLAIKFIREKIQTIKQSGELEHSNLLDEILNFKFKNDEVALGENIYTGDAPDEYRSADPIISQILMDGAAIFYAIVSSYKEVTNSDKQANTYVALSEGSNNSTNESIEAELIAAQGQVRRTLTEFIISHQENKMDNTNYNLIKKRLESDTTKEGDEEALRTRQSHTPLN